MNTTRRTFITRTAAAAGISAVAPGRLFAKPGKVSANDRITVAAIGLGPPRTPGSQGLPRSARRALRRHRRRPGGTARDHPQDGQPPLWQRGLREPIDMDEMLGRDDIDAVLIATGDRWHGTAAIMAARAGKDIYCEKPCTMSIEECRQLDEAVLGNKRIYQGGMQRRNVDNFRLRQRSWRAAASSAKSELHAGIWLPKPAKPDLPGEPSTRPRR
jgi:hypothetical protein